MKSKSFKPMRSRIYLASTILLYAGVSYGSCTLESVRCIGPGEEYNTSGVQNVETVFQAAVDSAQPGDTIKIRGGTYSHNEGSSRTTTFLTVAVSGTAANPITIQSYDGEHAVIEGFGFPEGSSGPTRTDETLIRVTGDHVHLKDLELKSSTRWAVVANGSYGLYENLEAHDCWDANIFLWGTGSSPLIGNRFRYIETYRSRHGAGLTLGPSFSTPQLIQGTVIEYILSHHNGFQPDGNKVPSVTGDTAGGGNSDGLGSSKSCHDEAVTLGVVNACPDTVIRGNVSWHNADDGIDVSMGDKSFVVDNISFNNGPEGNKGFKGFSYTRGGLTYMGNLTMNQSSFGFEALFEGEGYFNHNTSAHNDAMGIHYGVRSPIAGKVKGKNNLGFSNVGDQDMRFVADRNADYIELASNWSEDNSGDPQLTNGSFSKDSVITSFPSSYTIKQKLDDIRQQFITAYTPSESSPLIDAGAFDAGIHCATADDDSSNPMAPDAACRHWTGAAPDIGAFERGVNYTSVGYTAPPSPPVLDN